MVAVFGELGPYPEKRPNADSSVRAARFSLFPVQSASPMSFPAPLRFHPVFRDYIWGGQRLAGMLSKATGPGLWAESWEIVDHDQAQSIVDGGLWDGRTLGDLMTNHGPELVGRPAWELITGKAIPESLRGRFPLLLKFLDAAQDLSVQVHPDDELAVKLHPPDLGKTEAWYVLDAEPGATIYAGLRDGVSKTEFAQAVAAGRTAELLHSFQPRGGDCVFVPAGTVHAIGAGLMILEIQQASNTTWRVFDWDRVDKSGKARPLHIEQAIGAIDFAAGPVRPVSPQTLAPGHDRMVDSAYFRMERRSGSGAFSVGGDGRMRIVAVTRGEFESQTGHETRMLAPGDTCLIPAVCGPVRFLPGLYGELVEISLAE